MCNVALCGPFSSQLISPSYCRLGQKDVLWGNHRAEPCHTTADFSGNTTADLSGKHTVLGQLQKVMLLFPGHAIASDWPLKHDSEQHGHDQFEPFLRKVKRLKASLITDPPTTSFKTLF